MLAVPFSKSVSAGISIRTTLPSNRVSRPGNDNWLIADSITSGGVAFGLATLVATGWLIIRCWANWVDVLANCSRSAEISSCITCDS